MAFSTEVRINALKDCVNGKTDEQVSATHGVSTYTLSNWKKLLLTTGSLDKKKVKRKSGTPYKYKPEKLGAFLSKSKPPAVSEPKSTKASSPPQSQNSLLFVKPKKDKKKGKKKKKS